jgi:ABC-2 type transport system ATP-binding protein
MTTRNLTQDSAQGSAWNTAQDDVPFLDFRAVTIAYGKKQVVHDFHLRVQRGVTVGLIGLNGAGKTTLIKALLGLRHTQKGEIRLQGHDSAQPKNRRMLAYLPERFDPPSFMKGEEFIRFSMRLYDVPFDRDAMIALALRLKLDPKVLGNRMSTYSKGMRQKAGLMATVLTGCGLLILDEPMSGLDPAARAAVKDVLRQVRAEGRTVFFSSHILSDMDEICDLVAVMHQGRLMFEGTPAALKNQGSDANLERAFLAVIGDTGLSGAAA